MPKRTNSYQKLVEMIQKAYAPSGATITESAAIPGRDRFREVDVLFEGKLGLFSLKIAIEATSTKRKIDGPGIEKFIGKYHGSSVDKVVVVGRHFTREARKRALETQIQLWTLNEAEQSDWTRLAPQKMQLHLPPHVTRIDIVPSPPNFAPSPESFRESAIICKCCDRSKGTLGQFGELVLRTQVLPNPQVIGFLNQLIEQQNGCARFKMNLPFKGHWIRNNDKDYDFESLNVHIHYMRGEGDAIWSTYKLNDGEDDRIVDQMEVKVASKSLKIIFPKGMQSPQIVLNIDDDDSNKSITKVDADKLPSPMTLQAMPWHDRWI